MLRSYGMGWGGGGGPIPLVLTLGLWTLDLGLIIEQWKYFTDQKVESGAFSEIKRFRDQRMEIDCCDIFTDCQGLADWRLVWNLGGQGTTTTVTNSLARELDLSDWRLLWDWTAKNFGVIWGWKAKVFCLTTVTMSLNRKWRFVWDLEMESSLIWGWAEIWEVWRMGRGWTTEIISLTRRAKLTEMPLQMLPSFRAGNKNNCDHFITQGFRPLWLEAGYSPIGFCTRWLLGDWRGGDYKTQGFTADLTKMLLESWTSLTGGWCEMEQLKT